MTDNAPQFRIVYRGLTEETAQRLLNENVFTNKWFRQFLFDPLNAKTPIQF